MKKNKINFKNILVIAKKEITGYLDNPSFYVVMIVFLLLWFYIFFRSVFLIGENSLTTLFEMFPWFGLVFISAVTMGAVAKEKDDGTLELVLTHPVREIEFVIGKVAASFLFIFFTLLFTVPIAVVFSRYGTFDWGVYASQLLGASLFSLALISIGVFLSSLFNSQIAALLSTLGLGFLLIIIGTDLVTISIPQSLIGVFTGISLYSHFSSIIRGVIDIYDILYFILLTVIFILLTLFQLFKRKYGDYKARYSILQIITFGTLGAVFLLLVLKQWVPFRLDATQNRIFTLSDKTKVIIKNLPQTVNITVYRSEQLPSQYSPVLRDLKYILSNYKSVAGSKIEVSYIDPSKSPEEEQKAYEAGVQKMQFNVIGKEELQLKSGYMGLVISAGENKEAIPFVSSTEDIEYQLTSIIKQLTITDKKTIGILTGHEERSSSEYNYFFTEMNKQFNMIEVTLDDEDPILNENIDLLIISDPKKPYSEKAIQAIKNYVAQDNNLAVLYDGFNVSNDLLTQQNAGNLDTLLAEYGVKVNKDIAFDINSFSRISFRANGQPVAAPYPYWIVTSLEKNNPLGLKYVQFATMYWASTVSVDDAKLKELGYNKSDILVTTDKSGVVENLSNVYPSDQAPGLISGKKVLGIVLDPQPLPNQGVAKNGRIMVVGESDFWADIFLQRSPENLAFGVGTVTWTAGEESLADIQVKSRAFGTFKFTSESEPSAVKFWLIALPTVISVIVGLVRFTRRKTLRYQRVKV